MPEPRARTSRPGQERQPGGGVPRWVKVFAAVLGALVLAFVALHLTGLSPMMGHH